MSEKLKVYGRSARHARTLRLRAAMNMLAATFTVIPVTLWWTENPTSPYRTAAALFATAAVSAMVFDLSRYFDRAHVGIASERAALDALRSSSVTVVVCGARLPGRIADLDQVILDPSLALVEVKSGRGKVSTQGDSVRCGTRMVNGASLRRVRAVGAELGDRVGDDPALFICVVGMENEPFEAGGVTLCSAADLSRLLDALPPAHIGDPHRIARRLAARNDD